jgi:hypothetical protein
VIAGIAALVLLIAVAVFFVTRGDDDPAASVSDDTARTETTQDPDETETTDEPEDEPTTTTGDGVVSAGVIEYAALGDDWQVTDSMPPEFPGGAGQVQPTQADEQWVANVIVGLLDPTISYSGPDDVEAAARTLADRLIATHYGDDPSSEIVSAESREVDGHPAFVVRAELQFTIPDVEATGETVQVAVIDTGANVAAAFWGSVPDNAPELLPDMEAAFDSISIAG